MTDQQPALIVAPDGKPARRPRRSSSCPRCGAGEDKRVPSAGFGIPRQVCGSCGCEDFEEFDE